MENLEIRDEYIKLCQALKLSGMADSGSEAKEMILSLKVKVNGQADERIRRKLYPGDIVDYEGRSFKVVEKHDN